MKEIKGTEALSSKKPTGEVGTKSTGFASGGPFSCMNCVHMDHTENEDVCTHPSVNSDPELTNRRNDRGQVLVGYDECCRYVRPREGGEEEESAAKERVEKTF